MDSLFNLGVILASVREGRRGEAFAEWIHALLSERPEVAPVLLDLRQWPFPPYELRETPIIAEKKYAEGSLSRRWAEQITALDGFVIVTAEGRERYPR